VDRVDVVLGKRPRPCGRRFLVLGRLDFCDDRAGRRPSAGDLHRVAHDQQVYWADEP
jgi:hypothetical protein